MWQREFAATFPGHAVCDLTKDHLHQYFAGHGNVSPRTRNARRQAVRMFLAWAAERDFLPANHRLFAADSMRKETEDCGEIQFHTPAELRAMLDAATGDRAHLLPVLAISALAGLRLEEAVRLAWEDVFRVAGHIEVSSAKSKTRQRRLVTVCPALAQWLAPYCGRTGPVWAHRLERWHGEFNDLRASLGIASKRNALRHAFCSYHFALYANENLTAKEAGNSPTMLHHHYKGLATKAEAELWFATAPTQAANVIPLAAVSAG